MLGGDHHRPAGEERAERHPVRGAVHERAGRHAAGARLEATFRDLLGRGDRLAAAARAAHRAEEHVFVAPHHAFRHARGAAGVEDVEVVGGARAEIARRARGRDRRLVVDRRQAGGRRVGAVVDREEGSELRQRCRDRGELGCELTVEHDRARVGVVEQVAQLVLDVAVVDVDRHRAQLERGEHHFEVLDRVVEVAGDVVAGPDAALGERVGQAGRPRVLLGEGQPAIGAHQRLVIGHRVGDAFPQVGEVVLHVQPSRNGSELSSGP